MTEPDPLIDVQATETGPVQRRLEVVVAAKRVTRAFERAYRDLQQRVRVRGFRPGKAPRPVLERLYASVLAEQIERDLVAETLPEAVARSGIEPVAEPSVDADPARDGEAFRYRASLEVKPRIALPELSGLPARTLPVEVSEADVLRELEGLRERHAPIVEEPEGTETARGHFVVVDFEGRLDGQPFEGGTRKEVTVEVGSDRFLPGFEEQLLGARAGEDRTIRTTFPADWGNAALAGRAAEFQVHVLAVKRRQLPELDDEFAKDVGEEFTCLADLRARIRADLGAARERQARAALRHSLLSALIERTRFEVPPGLVERALQRRLAIAHRELEPAIPHEALHAQLSRWEEEWRPLAERDVREALLLEAVAEERGLVVETAELDLRLAELAKQQGTDLRRLRQSYEERGLLDALRSQMRDEKALDFLGAAAKVETTTGA
jgi:trigger factor